MFFISVTRSAASISGGGAQQRVTLDALPEAMAGVLYSEQPELEA